MANFTALAATAKRLIDANGRAISVVRLAQTVANPAKPWRGPSAPRGVSAVEVPGRGAFVVLRGADLGITFTTQDADAQVCLFPADSDLGNALELFDEIIDGAARWRIVEVQLLKPADKRLIYFFVVRQ